MFRVEKSEDVNVTDDDIEQLTVDLNKQLKGSAPNLLVILEVASVTSVHPMKTYENYDLITTINPTVK